MLIFRNSSPKLWEALNRRFNAVFEGLELSDAIQAQIRRIGDFYQHIIQSPVGNKEVDNGNIKEFLNYIAILEDIKNRKLAIHKAIQTINDLTQLKKSTIRWNNAPLIICALSTLICVAIFATALVGGIMGLIALHDAMVASVAGAWLVCSTVAPAVVFCQFTCSAISQMHSTAVVDQEVTDEIEVARAIEALFSNTNQADYLATQEETKTDDSTNTKKNWTPFEFFAKNYTSRESTIGCFASPKL